MKSGRSPNATAKYRYISNLMRCKTRSDDKSKAITLSNCFCSVAKRSVKCYHKSLLSFFDGNTSITNDRAKADEVNKITFIQFLLMMIVQT